MELRDLKGVVSKVPVVKKETTIRQLLDIMSSEHADVLPVVERSSLVGVVSEKDLLRLVRAQPVAGVEAVLVKELPKHIEGRYVSEIMTRRPISVSLGEDAESVLKKMAANSIRSVVVVDGDKIVGIAHARDILKRHYSFR